ncbi:MAG TPA: glycosyltransferase [Streptosporangiaceae bacterium]
MITAFIERVLPDTPMMVMIAGFHPEDTKTGPRPRSAGEPVDLDEVAPEAPFATPDSGVVALIARSSTDLRRAATLADLFPEAKHLLVAVTQSPPHRSFAAPAADPGWPPPRSLRLHRGPAGDWVIEGRFDRQMSMRDFVAATVRGLDGRRVAAPLFPRVALAGRGAAAWRPGELGTALVGEGGPLVESDGYLPADLVLRSTGPASPPWPDPLVPVVDRPRTDRLSWAGLGSSGGIGEARALLPALSDVDAVPPVDERSVNPWGFVSDPELGHGVLTQRGDRWCVTIPRDDGEEELVRFHPSGAVTDADVGRLRRLRSVGIEWGRHTGPIAAVRVIAGLAAAGVPLTAARVPLWAGALGELLASVITQADEDTLADDLRREEHSVRLRRAALRTHSSQARWRGLAASAGLEVPARPMVSVILCTRRPDFIGSALRQIARQRDVDVEVILTLHGVPAALPEVTTAAAGFTKPITIVEVPPDVPFGAALNRGIGRASGRYLAKWDDDDFYGPDFLADMVLASNYSGAELVGCFAQFTYLEQIDLTIYRRAGQSERMGRGVAGGTFVMERAFVDAIGGFPPVPRSVDAAMMKAVSAAGGRTYRTHGLGFMLNRRASGHTWAMPVTYFLRSVDRQWRGLHPSPLMECDATDIGDRVAAN